MQHSLLARVTFEYVRTCSGLCWWKELQACPQLRIFGWLTFRFTVPRWLILYMQA